MLVVLLALIIGFAINVFPFGLMHLLEGKRDIGRAGSFLTIGVYVVASFNLIFGLIWIPSYLSNLDLVTYMATIIGSSLAPTLTYYAFVKKRQPDRSDLLRLVFGISAMFVMFIGLSAPLGIYFIVSGIGLDGKADNLTPGLILISIGGALGGALGIRLYLFLCARWNIDPGKEFRD